VPLLGAHTLSATAFTGSGGSGTGGPPLVIGFSVVDPTPGNPGQFEWASRATAPLPRFEAQGTAVGDSVYVVGGFFNGALQVTNETRRYLPSTDTWSQVEDSPTQLTHSPQTIDGDTLYLVGDIPVTSDWAPGLDAGRFVIS
jgi:hypothetical protein